ncbi:MAG TPA: hypothetical protein VLH09_06685, partial [Bryobacteraceae bacterium]|nr:hypothetical protein [Bryobacteraceae bacterium]
IRDPAAVEIVRDRLQFGRQGLRWAHRGERIVFADALYQPALVAWERLNAHRPLHRDNRLRWQEALGHSGLRLSPVPIGPEEDIGSTAIVPHLLAPDFPLSAEEVYRVAVCENVPLGVQPVGPAYLEPAGQGLHGDAPHAEELARRLLFLPSDSVGGDSIPLLAQFLDQLERRWREFRWPYEVACEPAPLPDQFRHWIPYGILGRSLNGQFRLFDPIQGRLFSIPPAIAATLATSPAQPCRS